MSPNGEAWEASMCGITRLFQGASLGACKVREAARTSSKIDAPVLIIGDSGVGKDLVAREIHLR